MHKNDLIISLKLAPRQQQRHKNNPLDRSGDTLMLLKKSQLEIRLIQIDFRILLCIRKSYRLGITEVTKDESEILIISSLAAASFLICLVCTVYHRRKRRKHHHRQLGLHRSGGHYDSTTSATG